MAIGLEYPIFLNTTILFRLHAKTTFDLRLELILVVVVVLLMAVVVVVVVVVVVEVVVVVVLVVVIVVIGFISIRTQQ